MSQFISKLDSNHYFSTISSAVDFFISTLGRTRISFLKNRISFEISLSLLILVLSSLSLSFDRVPNHAQFNSTKSKIIVKFKSVPGKKESQKSPRKISIEADTTQVGRCALVDFSILVHVLNNFWILKPSWWWPFGRHHHGPTKWTISRQLHRSKLAKSAFFG